MDSPPRLTAIARASSVKRGYQQNRDVNEDSATTDYISTDGTTPGSSISDSTNQPSRAMSNRQHPVESYYSTGPNHQRRRRPTYPNSRFPQSRWPWDQDYPSGSQYDNPLLPVRYSPYYPQGQQTYDSLGAYDMLRPYQHRPLFSPHPPPPPPPPPTLPPTSPTTTSVVPPKGLPTERTAERETDTVKSLVPASVHSSNISNGTEGLAITHHKPKSKIHRAVDAVHDPSISTKDICVQLELPIEDDPGTSLETFSRFRRLGRFVDAKEFFDTQLDNFRTTPYIFVQYAEMLFASGELKGFRELVYPDDFFHTGPALPNNELAASFELMKFLAQPLFIDYPIAIMQVVRAILSFLKTETIWGSTEIQLYTLCLQVIKLIQDSSDHAICPENDECHHAADIINWPKMYSRLLGEHRIWDFRDLFVTAISVYGWQRTTSLLFGPKHIFDTLEGMNKDWRQSENDESMVLGLLDLFTSLILQNRSTEKRQIAELLCIYSRSLAETVQAISFEHMKTRPFIQWILAKALTGMSVKSQSFDGLTLEDFPGLLINHEDNGVHLPIFLPVHHSVKPGWDLFHTEANSAQIRSMEIAIQAAVDIGDYSLQILGLKILALHSREPGSVLDTLANIQLTKMGDREGFLQTCLSKYLALSGREDEEALLESFRKVETSAKGLQNKSLINPTFLWARDVILGHLEAQTLGEVERSAVWWLDLDGYGMKLPRYVVDFVNQNLGSTLSSSRRSISAMYSGRAVAQSRQGLETEDSNSKHPSPFDYLESDSALASLLYAPKAAVHGFNSSNGRTVHFEGHINEERPSTDSTSPAIDRIDSGNTADGPHAQRLNGRSTDTAGMVEDTSDQMVDDSDSSQNDSGSELSTSVRMNKGLPNLEFPPSLLNSNTLTVTVTSKTDPTKSTTYVLDKNGAAISNLNTDNEPSTKAHNIQPASQDVEPENQDQTTRAPGPSAPNGSATPRKVSNPIRVKDTSKRLAQDKPQSWEHHKESSTAHYIEELEAQASYLRHAQASHRQHQRDEDLAFQYRISQIEAEAARARNEQTTVSHMDRTGYMQGDPVPLRPIARSLSDRFQLNQGIGRVSSWPMSMPAAAEHETQLPHKRMTRDSSKTRSAKRAGISKEVLDQLNEERVGKNRRSGSVTAYNDPESVEHSVLDSHDLDMKTSESLVDDEDQDHDTAMPKDALGRMKNVPDPPPRRKVHIKEKQHDRTTAVATAGDADVDTRGDNKEQTIMEEQFTAKKSKKSKGKDRVTTSSQLRGSSEPGARRRPMKVQIQTDEEEQMVEKNDLAEAKNESTEQGGHKDFWGDQRARWGLGIIS